MQGERMVPRSTANRGAHEHVCETEDCEEQSLRNKIAAARVILLNCKHNIDLFHRKCQTNQDIEYIIKETTCFPRDTVRSFVSTLKPRRSFLACLSKSNQHKPKKPYEFFRDIIYTYYLKNQTVPTKLNILLKCQNKDKHYTMKTLNKDFKVNGFVLKKLGKTSKALIVEEPKQVYRRMKYLNKVRNFRFQERNFVYVTHKDDEFSLAVCPKSGEMNFKSYADEEEAKTDQVSVFAEILVSILPKSSVVILDIRDAPKLNPTPNQYSSKQKMQEWLTKHDIPYEEEAHTAELYALVHRFKKYHQESCKIQHLLECYGFDVLRVPNELPVLSYFHLVFKQIKGLRHMLEANYISSIFKKYGSDELRILEETLVKEEVQIYSEDLELEKIIDTIDMTSTKTLFLPRDLKSCEIYDPEAVPSYIILDEF